MTKTAIAEDRADRMLMTQPSSICAAKFRTTSVARKEIKPLTSLRFFAALAILLYHGGERFTCLQGLHNKYIPEQAVTFFFVLSGFILTYNYVDLKDFKATVSFYFARFSRIWPAHVASLSLLLFLLPEVFKVKPGDAPLFLRNLFLLQSWGTPSRHAYFSYNATAWSISTEMFFYLCFPFLLWGMKKKWYLPLAVTTFVLALLIGFSNSVHLPEFAPMQLSYQGLLFISPLSSIFSFGIGMTTAVFWRNRVSSINLNRNFATLLELSIIAWVCIINQCSSTLRYASVPWAGDGGAFWLQNTGSAVLGCAMLIIIFALDSGWISKLLRAPLLVLLGELSFGIYLLHSVLITFLGVNFPQEQSVNACLVFIASLFVSTHLMFEIVEKPMRKLMMKYGLAFINFAESKIQLVTSSNTDSLHQTVPVLLSAVTEDGAAAARGIIPLPAVVWRRILLVLESLAFGVFVYFSLPTIHHLTDAEASSMADGASVSNITLSPYLMCRSAKAHVSGDEVSLSLVWKALKPETVNFTVKIVALNSSGKPLGSTTYTQDGRQQWVKRGTCWIDRATIGVAAKEVPTTVAITVLRNKHVVLHSTPALPGDLSLSVPVLPALANKYSI